MATVQESRCGRDSEQAVVRRVHYKLPSTPLVTAAGVVSMLLVYFSLPVALSMIGLRWFSKCPACGKRRARWVKAGDRQYNFRCSACGFTKEKVWRDEAS